VSTLVQWTAGAEQTDSNNYPKGNNGCDNNAYVYVNPASQTQPVRMIVTGNVTVTMFNTEYIWKYGNYVVKMHWNWVL
jgi:hypothetical protein